MLSVYFLIISILLIIEEAGARKPNRIVTTTKRHRHGESEAGAHFPACSAGI